MSRGQNKSTQRRKPNPRKLSRSTQKRKQKLRILIVGDGEKTEPQYFDGLRMESSISSRFYIRVVPGKGGSAAETVRIAILKSEEAQGIAQDNFDKVYCMIDVEGPDQEGTLQDALKEAEKASIEVCLSNPCFECWYLAHFDRISRSFTAQDIRNALSRKWRDEFKKDYRKQDPDHYPLLKDKTTVAITNASNVIENDHSGRIRTQCNSSTEVYKLVSYLLNPDDQPATP